MNWFYTPILEFGDNNGDPFSRGIDTNTNTKSFVRLAYVDNPSVTTLTEARDADFDSDGLSNYNEVVTPSGDTTNPFDWDTDNDLMSDGWESSYRPLLDPNDPSDAALDPDLDELSNLQEFQTGTDPTTAGPDSDGNGIPDQWELVYAGKFRAYPSTLFASLAYGDTRIMPMLLRNDTDATVDYTIGISGSVAVGIYSYKDSINDGVEFAWNDIAQPENILVEITDGDEESELVQLGFDFPFASSHYQNLWVSTNGMLTFNGAFDWTWPDLPQSYPDPSAPDPMIAPFWDDLYPAAGGDIYFKSFGDHAIVQFQQVASYNYPGSYTFQAILYQDGTIKFLYKSETTSGPTSDASLGLQDVNAGVALTLPKADIFQGSDVAFLISSEIKFIRVQPIIGSVPAHSVVSLDAIFDSTNLPNGLHSADIGIADNIPGTTTQHLTATMEVTLDWDEDGLPDQWEFANGLDPYNPSDAELDPDSDQLNNTQEFLAGTSPVSDDSDQDGLKDGDELLTHGTNPLLKDTEGDGMEDGFEWDHGFDPLVDDGLDDKDGDRIPNVFEFSAKTDPADVDSFPNPTHEVDPANGNADPGDNIYVTIDEALNAAYARDEDLDGSPDPYPIIFVHGGVYNQGVALANIPILLLGELSSSDAAEIRPTTPANSLSITSRSVVDGFVITHEAGVSGFGVYVSRQLPETRAHCRLVNCIIRGNTEIISAGISATDCELTLIHCTVTGNSASMFGSPIGLNNTNLHLVNTVIADNTSSLSNGKQIDMYNGSVVLTSASSPSMISDAPLTPTPGWVVCHDPGLTSTGYIIDAYSPVVNAGGAMDTTVVKYDIRGHPRSMGSAPDVGADEFVGNSSGPLVTPQDAGPAFDTDGDGIPNQWEIAHNLDPNTPNPESDLLAYLNDSANTSDLLIHTPLQ